MDALNEVFSHSQQILLIKTTLLSLLIHVPVEASLKCVAFDDIELPP